MIEQESKISNPYDSDDYYDSDGRATRLARSLNTMLFYLEWLKARFLVRKIRAISPILLNGQDSNRILDVGAGDGKFLHFMQGLGFQPFGTTASKISQSAAKTQFGVHIEFARELPPDLRNRKYEIITYWHVFEHLEDPAAHVQSWTEVLAKDGVVVVEVPNIESIGARLGFSAWLGSDLKHHINHMPDRKLRDLFQDNGFAIKRTEHFSLKFTVPFLWSGLLGGIWPNYYSFDTTFGLIKDPWKALGQAPLRTLNGLLSIIYLLPVIAALLVWGVATQQGEVLRYYLQRKT